MNYHKKQFLWLTEISSGVNFILDTKYIKRRHRNNHKDLFSPGRHPMRKTVYDMQQSEEAIE